ncbi:MAG: molybdate ABC transporter permease subunit [Acidobacteriota bacterium]
MENTFLSDLGIILFTLRVAAESTLLIAPLALALAVALRSLPVKLRTTIEAFVTLPLVLPPTAIGLVLFELFSRRHPVGAALDRMGVEILFTPTAAVIAAAVMSFPLMFRAFRLALDSSNFRLFDIARTLGVSRTGAFFRVIVPLSWPGIVTGLLLAWCRAIGEFGATVLVAGNIPARTQTISMAIYNRVQSGREGETVFLLASVVIVAFTALAATEVLTRGQRRRLAR